MKPDKAKIPYDFVPIPLSIIEKGNDLSLAEHKLLLYLVRHLVPFGNKDVRLTDDEIMHGRKRKGGDRMDKGCRLTPKPLVEARKGLQGRGIITVIEDVSDPARPRRFYKLNLENAEIFSRVGESPTPKGESTTEVGGTPSQVGESPTRTYNRDTTKDCTKEITIPPISPTGRLGSHDISLRFEEFWKHSNQKGSKPLALIAFTKAVKEGHSPDFMIGAAKEHKAFEDSLHRSFEYRRDTSLWITKREFLDKPKENDYESNKRVANREKDWAKQKARYERIGAYGPLIDSRTVEEITDPNFSPRKQQLKEQQEAKDWGAITGQTSLSPVTCVGAAMVEAIGTVRPQAAEESKPNPEEEARQKKLNEEKDYRRRRLGAMRCIASTMEIGGRLSDAQKNEFELARQDPLLAQYQIAPLGRESYKVLVAIIEKAKEEDYTAVA
jgi:hypothetical protein